MNSIPMSTDLVERVARALAKADGKDPDAPAWMRYPGGHAEGVCWGDQYADKARAALEALPIGELVDALEEWRRIHLLLKNGESVGGLTIEDALDATDAALSRAAPENNDG